MPTIKANGIDIWYETFGRADDPTILLISGATAQAIGWDCEFCERIASGGRQVVRFDNRDVGLSQWFGDEDLYDLHDMVADTVGLMDTLGIERAHVAGASMGGMIAQLMAIGHPERVHTLTSIISSPAKTGDPEFEPGDPRVMETAVGMAGLRVGTREERIEASLPLWRILAGSRYPFDEQWWRDWIGQSADRAWHPEVMAHHPAAIERTEPWHGNLGKVRAPTLIIHGMEDPIFPISHAQRMAELVPNAKVLWLEGVGHEMPPACWDEVITALLEHTGRTAAIA